MATLSEPGPASIPVPPRRFHVLTVFFDIGSFVRRAALPMVVAVVQAPSAADVVLPLIVLVGLAGQVVSWLRRTYSVEGGVLRLDEGVLQRRQRAVPLDRIQQVDVQRTLRHRFLGVATLRVETAGDASGPEVVLNVVALSEVERLRALLLAARRPAGVTGAAAVGGEPTPPTRAALVTLGSGEVALAGMTGAHLGVMLTILAWPLQLLDDLPGNQIEDLDASALNATSSQLLVAAVLLPPLWLALAAVASLVRDGRFTLTRDGDEVVVRRGLLETREAHMALARIQVVHVTQGVLRRPLRMVSLRIQSAGGSGDTRRVSVPIVPVSAVDRIVGELLPGATPLAALEPAPRAAARRRRVRGVGVGTVAALPFLVLATQAAPWLALAALAPAVGWWLGGAWYRALGHSASDSYVVTRRGAIWRRTAIVPIGKVQSTRVESTPLQRWAGLATTHLDLAARGTVPAVIDETAPTARAVARLGLTAPSWST